MTISATILADSISPEGKRLTTFQLRYPRAIHAEFMTHRMFSRNASSSRAIPVERLIQDVMEDPFIPSHWGKNQKGMQAGEEWDASIELPAVDFTPDENRDSFWNFGELVAKDFVKIDRNARVGFGYRLMPKEAGWIEARDYAVAVARAFDQAGYHKQIVNRLLEPFAHINVVVTATEWANFFNLRNHPDAEPHIHDLACMMETRYVYSIPDKLGYGQWHLPYIRKEDWNEYPPFVDLGNGNVGDSGWDLDSVQERLVKVSVARCARVSYRTHEGKPTSHEDDVALHDRLVVATPLHASPAEHQAYPDPLTPFGEYAHPELHGNLKGWCQYRKMLPGENFVG